MSAASRWIVWLPISLLCLFGLSLFPGTVRAQQVPTRPETKEEFQAFAAGSYKELIAPYWKSNCYHCHGNDKAIAALNLEKFKPDFLNAETVEILSLTYERMRDGEMPPSAEDPEGETEEHAPASPEANIAIGTVGRIASMARYWHKDFEPDYRPLRIGAGDDKLLRLLKQRRNAAAVQAMASKGVVEQGIGEGIANYERYLQAITAVVDADLELAEGAPAQIAALRKKIGAYRNFESFVWDRFRSGSDPAEAFYAVKGKRLAAQIELQRVLDRSQPKK